MTAPQSFTRRSTRIEAMRLDGASQMLAAHRWLRDHGVRGMLVANDDGTGFLTIYGQGPIKLVARIGQWLAYDPAARQFAVYNHNHFVQDHPEAQETQ